MSVTPIIIDGLPTLTLNGLETYSGSFDGTQDIIPVYENATTSTVGVSRNTMLGLTSAPVGISDSQTLTNKTITSPTISGPTLSGTIIGTYTIGGTPTFPASVVTLTGSQTLTNKILTSPTINAPTITNATISADTVSGFSASTTGTIYGISVSSGQISSALTMTSLLTASAGLTVAGTLTLANNTILAPALATSAILLGYTQIVSTITTTATSVTQATGLTQAVTIPAGGRKTKITVQLPEVDSSSATTHRVFLSIWDGTVGSGTQLTTGVQVIYSTGSVGNSMTLIAVVSPSSGSKTYNLGWFTDSGVTASITCSSISPAFILVEAV